MTPQKLVVTTLSLIGGAVGLFAPVGVVKWLLRTEPEDAGILTLFFLPVWCLLLVLGLLIGRRLGLLMTGGNRAALIVRFRTPRPRRWCRASRVR
jgi:hypothetical protein